MYSFKFNQAIELVSIVLTNGLESRGFIPGRVTPKIQRILPDVALVNTQHYKVRIKSKVEQSMEWSSTLPLYLGVVAIETKRSFRVTLDNGRQLLTYMYQVINNFDNP